MRHTTTPNSVSQSGSLLGTTMTQGEAKTIPLTGARTPADAGLSGLGLLMQLTGSVFLAYGALLVMLPLFVPSTCRHWPSI